jgi:hypothetical protein
MSVIPLDFQRRCEQRWAARFARQAPKPSSQKREHENHVNSPARPQKPEGQTADLQKPASVEPWIQRRA